MENRVKYACCAFIVMRFIWSKNLAKHFELNRNGLTTGQNFQSEQTCRPVLVCWPTGLLKAHAECYSVFALPVNLFGFLTSSTATRLYRGRAPRQERLTILRAATHETELGDHDFCLSRSHYTGTDPTCRERAALPVN